ncbi:MAG TPA: aminotransferase class I/II-fold pyridoxal phosphate-dependent enzyme [Methanofastidiosum sp.]|nr:aminotransferase class I/II-fold pyridoxal phosphate-dependent enzyme [Methanofastidiosum sp.]HNU61671.1 aminotransferase class I/II-fold pyridoxal phosphate-dependent enzyme [Methanofastidiosum sp.]
MNVSERSSTISYAIRDVVEYARKLESKGDKILKLNIGDPLKFDFKTPEPMVDAIINAARGSYNGYEDSLGNTELRRVIAERESKNNGKIYLEDVVVTSGVTEGVNLVFGATLEPGDEVLVPGPGYPTYTAYANFFGATPVPYRTIEKDGWNIDVQDLKSKITERTKCIVLINPNNPTGAIYPKKTLKDILDIAIEHDVFIISDEIYDRITFDDSFVSPASMTDEVPILTFNGISKIYLAPGWRVGYMAFYNWDTLFDIKEGIMKELRARISANSICQAGAIEAYKGSEKYVVEMVSKLKQRSEFAYKRLNEIPGISTTKPMGGLYIFPKIDLDKRWKDDKEFVYEFLKMKKVLLVHGSGFCPIYGKGHFRSVFLPPIETMEDAFSRLEDFMKTKK